MGKAAEDFFRQEVDSYKLEHYQSGYRTFMSVRHDCFLEEIDKLVLKPGATALDAGCGPGLMSKAMAERGLNVTAVDTSEAMLELTSQLFSEEDQPIFKQGSIEDLPFADDSFNLVVSAGVIEYLATDDLAVAEFNRVLTKDGYLVLSVTNRFSPIGIIEPLIESIKRNRLMLSICNTVLKWLGSTPVRPREFNVRKHAASELNASFDRNGFERVASGYFYVLPWPHPFDRVFPRASAKLGGKLEFLSRTLLGWMAEGYYVVGKK